MARRGNYSYKKHEKELKRKKKAKEKLDRRQGNKNPSTRVVKDVDGPANENSV
jgi:hypothetical protein